jgi:hypothetical protein
MARKVHPEGAIIYRKSHKLVPLKSGIALETEVEGPFLFSLDEELRQGPLPTFFTEAGVVATNEFHQALVDIGINNIQAYQALIIDKVDGRKIEGYCFLNIVGLVSCANLDESEAEILGEDMLIINQLVLDGSKIPPLDIFLVAEDTDNIIVSERVYRHLSARGYDDVYFEELRQT